MSSATLQDDPSVESFFNVVETETLALFEYLPFEFLEEFDVFAPARDALAVEQPIWMAGDSAHDTLDWHNHLLAARGRAGRSVQRTKH